MNSRHLPKSFFEGEPYVDSQVVSTSASHALTHAWYKSNKCELAIYLPKGSTAANVSNLGIKHEAETILPPNTAYKYIGIVGYRKSITDNEPHPIYAVEAYTPKKTDISGTISKNMKVFNEIRDSGRMPDEFHKGIYNIAQRLATNHTSFMNVSEQFGQGVSKENVLEYYNKYKDLFTGGEATPKGAHSGWEDQFKLSNLQSGKSSQKGVSSSKSQPIELSKDQLAKVQKVVSSSKSQPTELSKDKLDKVQKGVDLLKQASENIDSIESIHSLYLDVSENLPIEYDSMSTFSTLKKEASNLGYKYKSPEYTSHVVTGMLKDIMSKYGSKLGEDVSKTSNLKKASSKKV